MACLDGRTVGMVAYCLVPRLDGDHLSCRVSDLVVLTEMRRRGVGRALLGAVEAAARRAGARRLDLSTGDWRTDAHAFYDQAGFRDNARAMVRHLD